MAGKFLKRKKTIVGGDIGPAAKLDNPVKNKKFPELSKRKLIILALIIILTGAGLVVAFSQLNNKESAKNNFVKACSDEILTKAVQASSPDNGEKLHEVVHEIKGIPQYDQDPNCLYVEITDLINSSEASAARPVFEKYKVLYEPSRISQVLLDAPSGVLTVEEIEQTLNSIEKINQENASSQTIFNVEGPAQ
jgi:hypothetical protein